MARYTVRVDKDLCGGHGECVVAAPEVFDFTGDDDVVSVLDEHPGAEYEEAVDDAESRCPNAAIHVHKG